MDVRALQRPLKEQYRREPSSSRITLTAKGSETTTPLSCSVDIGRAIYQAEAHKGVGGTGAGACSGDLLLGALAACAQLTCQLVATAIVASFLLVPVQADAADLSGGTVFGNIAAPTREENPASKKRPGFAFLILNDCQRR